MANDKTPVNSKSENPSQTPSAESISGEIQAIRNRDSLQEMMLTFVEMLERNKVLVAGVAGLALAIGLGTVGWGLLSERKEKSAQEAFYGIEKQYSTKREKFDQAKFGALTGAKVDELVKAGAAAHASGDLSKDYGTTVEELESFAQDHKGTAAAVQASLLAAETRIEYKQPEQAAKSLESALTSTKANSLLGALVRMAAGNAQAMAGQCDQALKAWDQVLAAKDLGFLHAEAALRSGLCLEKVGDKPKAIEMYRKASSEGDKSTSSQTARSLLRALEIGS